MKANAQSREQRCPACGGSFTISAGRRKKVQCPQCREIVTLDEFAGVDRKNSPVAAADLATNPERMAAWESLRSRVETLEQQVEALMVSSRARSPLLPERVTNSSPATTQAPADAEGAQDAKLSTSPEASEPKEPRRLPYIGSGTAARSAEHASNPPSLENGKLETEQAALAQFQRVPVGECTLRVVAGDRAAWQIANALTDVLTKTGWSVGEVIEDAALSRGCRGLTLSIGSSIPIRRVTRTLEALREAGYGLTFQIDPACASNEAVLIVGIGSSPEKSA